MINRRLSELESYPFQRVRDLLAAVPAGSAPGAVAGAPPFDLGLGNPMGPIPPMVGEILAREAGGFNGYPPPRGEGAFREACRDWMGRRYGISDDVLRGLIDAERGVIPLSGTKEGLFQVALAVLTPSDRRPPKVMLPNPFYPVYAGAARLAGGAPLFLPAPAESGFLPDFSAIPEGVWAETGLVYLCTPGNPQGMAADADYIADLILKCRAAGAVLVLDECYTEIWHTPKPPVGALQVIAERSLGMEGVLLFHSLSKRSNAAGLRAGFVAGDPALVDAVAAVRNYGAAGMPVPVQRAAAALWADDDHAAEIRAGYQARIDLAEQMLAPAIDGFQRPDGGFFLWLPVGDGEAATRHLWRHAGLKVLPGAYLAAEAGDGSPNPGAAYIRVALVHPLDRLEPVLAALAGELRTFDPGQGGRLS